MEHATSNANDVGGHCRLPRKYIWPVQSKSTKKKRRGGSNECDVYER